MYIYICICIYLARNLDNSRKSAYIYVHVYMCIYIYDSLSRGFCTQRVHVVECAGVCANVSVSRVLYARVQAMRA
jgi:hypothetical protein